MSGPPSCEQNRPSDAGIALLPAMAVVVVAGLLVWILVWLAAGDSAPVRGEGREAQKPPGVDLAATEVERASMRDKVGEPLGATDGSVPGAEGPVRSEADDPDARTRTDRELPWDRVILTARLFYPDRKRPMPGARVLLTYYRLSDSFERRVLTHAERQPTVRTTDAEGRARFELTVDEDADYRGVVYFTAPGFEAEPVSLYSIEGGAAIDLRDVVMKAVAIEASPGNRERRPKALELLRLIESANRSRERAVRKSRNRQDRR